MVDIYATPESDVVQSGRSARVGGNIEDAIDGIFDVGMFAILGEAWRGLKGFKLKCHILTMLYFIMFGAESQTLAD